MHVDYKALNTEDFIVGSREHPVLGPVIVINPQKGKFKFADDELHLRSLVCRPDGEVISAGFPKFFNFKEYAPHDALTLTGLGEDTTLFTAKVDGSLIIRTVIDGYVYFRTRGSHELGAFEEPVMALINEWYPELLDPSYTAGADTSLLFEYTAPTNQVVIRYEQPYLWALARVDFLRDSLPQRLEVRPFPIELLSLGRMKFPMDQPPRYAKMRTPEEVERMLNTLGQQEGYVTWTLLGSEGYHLSKWKTGWYMRLHALRSEASPRFIREYCYQHDVKSLEGFKAAMAKDGADWESISYLEPSYREVEKQFDNCEHAAGVVVLKLIERNLLGADIDRKTKALGCKALSADIDDGEWVFNYAMMTAVGDQERAQAILWAKKLDMGVNEFKAFLGRLAKAKADEAVTA